MDCPAAACAVAMEEFPNVCACSLTMVPSSYSPPGNCTGGGSLKVKLGQRISCDTALDAHHYVNGILRGYRIAFRREWKIEKESWHFGSSDWLPWSIQFARLTRVECSLTEAWVDVAPPSESRYSILTTAVLTTAFRMPCTLSPGGFPVMPEPDHLSYEQNLSAELQDGTSVKMLSAVNLVVFGWRRTLRYRSPERPGPGKRKTTPVACSRRTQPASCNIKKTQAVPLRPSVCSPSGRRPRPGSLLE